MICCTQAERKNYFMLQVLIVDDHASIRRLLTVTLSNEFTVQEAWVGENALDIVRRFNPKIVLIEPQLSGLMNGFDLLEAIKSNPATQGIQVAMVAASSEASDQKKAEALGASAYFIKPFNAVQLKTWVRSHI